MKLYRLLTGTDDAAFCHKVTAALNKGWDLHGSPTTSIKPDGAVLCAQAVYKKVKGTDYHPDMKLGEQ